VSGPCVGREQQLKVLCVLQGPALVYGR